MVMQVFRFGVPGCAAGQLVVVAWRVALRAMVVVVVCALVMAGLGTAAAGQEGFSDVEGVSHASNIAALDGLGVFEGTECGGMRFCPDDPVMRWTAAVWIVRVLDGGVPGRVVESRFVDVGPDDWWLGYVERLAELGVTVGCKRDPLRFCPDDTVTRAQMATLLKRSVDGRPGEVVLDSGPRSGDSLIAATAGRACTVRPDTTVACWGGDEGYLEHLSVAGLGDVVALSTPNQAPDAAHSCAVHRDGRVSCWGSGGEGQLGVGDTGTHHLPRFVPGIDDAVAVAVGPSFTCVLDDGGEVWCWGTNRFGQLGDDDKGSDRSWPYRIRGLGDVAAISAGQFHSCGVHIDGRLSCWGWIYDDTPTAVETPSEVNSVAIGGAQTCITTVEGAVYCWDHGAVKASEMTQIVGVDDAVKVSVGDATVCVLHRDGAVSCWGDNTVGQLGDGTTTSSTVPVRVRGVNSAVDVSVSSGSRTVAPHVCARHSAGSVTCWGGNDLGQLGATTAINARAQSVALPEPVAPSAAPATHTELLRVWVDSVVERHEGSASWMRVAWDHIRGLTVADELGPDGDVLSNCYVDSAAASASELVVCEVWNMTITDMSLKTVVHQLARVYDLHTDLAPRDAWGAVQLYFAHRYPDCFAGVDRHGSEILADTMLHLAVPHARLDFYERHGCIGLAPQPSTDDERLVMAALVGEVSHWYKTNITNGYELWTTWRRGPSLPVLANLASQFEGLCVKDWIRSPLDPALFPSIHNNPFGRC